MIGPRHAIEMGEVVVLFHSMSLFENAVAHSSGGRAGRGGVRREHLAVVVQLMREQWTLAAREIDWI